MMNTNFNKSLFIISGVLIYFLIQPCFSQINNHKGSEQNKKPNVIVIMTDDQGYGELSVHGNPILKTPELDKLHSKSARLTDFHVAPMCTPTRGQLLTGMDAARNGATNVSSGRTHLKNGLKTMADYFSENGYNTGIFGKWHLGDNYPSRPEDRGFKETLWFPSSHIGSAPDYWGNDYFDDVYIKNGQREKYQGYCTDVFFDKAKEWISDSKDKNLPFFTYIPTNAPHQPFYALEKDIKEMEVIVENSEFSSMEADKKYKFIRYLAMIRNIDKNVGELMDFLKRKTLLDNTIVVFLSDNGSTFGPDYFNAGMRGGKTELYEGGHRVPFFISWPNGAIKSGDVSGLSQAQDVLPTLLDLCGIERSSSEDFDGISLASAFSGERKIDPNRSIVINFSRMPFYFDYPSPYSNSMMRMEGAAVLWKNWRLLNDNELYDLTQDPLQQNNIINDHPTIVAQMRLQSSKKWDLVKDVANVPQRIIIGSKHEESTMLSASDWMDVFLDQQIQVSKGLQRNSYWLLEIETSGVYTFELRRYPKESDMMLTAEKGDAKSLPIHAAKIFVTTESNELRKKSLVKEGDKGVRYTFQLEKGPIALHTWFEDVDGEGLAGAYYVYVTKTK
ncbi:arylsulfatase [Arenibacter sp. F26102]|uniref:arylsulfatase n=1 Tax=Arenibacter sp. F26102 TaxID=2926416 RepID=UPI001FF6B332|nr:arylsulfatase [Arenibacter sp. F26102]MCK0148233.1 arylsulfatase [Arenibacter sp. F26102]